MWVLRNTSRKEELWWKQDKNKQFYGMLNGMIIWSVMMESNTQYLKLDTTSRTMVRKDRFPVHLTWTVAIIATKRNGPLLDDLGFLSFNKFQSSKGSSRWKMQCQMPSGHLFTFGPCACEVAQCWWMRENRRFHTPKFRSFRHRFLLRKPFEHLGIKNASLGNHAKAG